jgi:DNA-binding GntR family transcriptional regulator
MRWITPWLEAMHNSAMTLDTQIVSQILALIRAEGWPAGTHLPAQMLADQLRVSRSPINEALAHLHEQGMLVRERYRGYFVSEALLQSGEIASSAAKAAQNPIRQTYFQMAEDRLQGTLEAQVSETQLKSRYGLTSTQLQSILSRISQEGWIQKKPGYGWEFSSMLTTPDSLLQSYRLRLAVEPAALLEPHYKFEAHVLARCRAAEQHLLSGGIETDSAEQLHERGVYFHESVVRASGNAFFIDTIERVNRVRRLLSYRSARDRKRYREHCFQHLRILDLIEAGEHLQASQSMREHLQATMSNMGKITDLLQRD